MSTISPLTFHRSPHPLPRCKSLFFTSKAIDFRLFTEGCSIYRLPGVPDEEIPDGDVILQIDGYSKTPTDQLLAARYRFMMSSTDFRAIYSMIFVKCPSMLELDDYIRSVISEAHYDQNSILIGGKRSRHRILTRSVDIHLRNALKKSIRARYCSLDSEFSRHNPVHHTRRKAFDWLPTHFSSDLIHGSWWYLWSSVLSTLLCIGVLLNSYSLHFSGDGSTLPESAYRAAWWLMLISSVFFTLGSFLYIRVCNDPPIPPLCCFRCLDCLASDEIFAYWMFLFGVFPSIPYCMVYLVYSRERIYFWGLISTLVVIFLMLLFILISSRSKPSDNGSRNLFVRVMRAIMCNSRFVETHLATDFLFLMWVCFWGSLVSLIVFVIFLIEEAATGSVSSLFLFIDVMR